MAERRACAPTGTGPGLRRLCFTRPGRCGLKGGSGLITQPRWQGEAVGLERRQHDAAALASAQGGGGRLEPVGVAGQIAQRAVEQAGPGAGPVDAGLRRARSLGSSKII